MCKGTCQHSSFAHIITSFISWCTNTHRAAAISFYRLVRHCAPLQDNATVLYVHQWKDTRTQLAAVALLLQAPAQAPNSLNLPSPLVKNSLVAGTNRTLLPFLLMNAAITTPQPLLVFITTNVSLGAHPPLPVTGIAINRPVVFIGLQSLVTSIDFEMVVNQLNATSKYSNITVVGLVLENLAPGDAETSAVASPFSIAISNNLWAAFYNSEWPACSAVQYSNQGPASGSRFAVTEGAQHRQH